MLKTETIILPPEKSDAILALSEYVKQGYAIIYVTPDYKMATIQKDLIEDPPIPKDKMLLLD